MKKEMFSAPPEGAIPTAQDRAPAVKFKAMKTPQQYANIQVNLPEQVESFRLGFHYYDKEAQAKVSLPELTFVVLEVYAGVSGYNGSDTSFWSNRALDTRTDELIVYSSTGNAVIAKGLYQNIKATLPEGAKYTKFAKAFCVQMDRVVEIELTAAVERGMQKAVAATDERAGKKQKWQGVFILGLAQNDHLWGFHLTGYSQVNKDGSEYSEKGDLFYEPVFYSGIVDAQSNADLHAQCVEAQENERALHEQYKVKYANETASEPQDPVYVDSVPLSPGADDFPNEPPPF